MWTGTLNRDSSVTINGLSACKVIGLEFKNGGGQIFPVVIRSGEIRFSATQFVPEVTYWDIQDWGGRITVTGNVLKVLRCSIALSRANAVGQGLSIVGYNDEPITAVWRIL